MLRLAGVALSIGLADSLNPSTVGPALYLATGRRRVLRVLLFAAGVLAVDLAAGIALTMGPGRLLLGLVPHPRSTVRHALELAAGVALIAVAAGLWLGRRRLARRTLPAGGGRAGSGFLAGASIAAVELPTAAPYLAVIVAVAASSATRTQAIGLLALYCVAFVAPLLAIVGVLLAAGTRADPVLDAARRWLQRRWPVVLSALLVLAGGVLTVAGAVGLAGR